MKLIKIDKKAWTAGLEKLSTSYQLYGPVKEQHFYNFRALQKGELPDLSGLNSRMSPKGVVYPQSQVMFTYTLDENQADHHILKEVGRDDFARAVIGIRPCDAAAFLMVKQNFDAPEFKDPYWLKAYEATVKVGLACNEPCQTCFCTSTGCGPFSETGLDVLLVDTGDAFLARALNNQGVKFLESAGWSQAAEADELEAMKKKAEDKIVSAVSTDRLKDKKTTDLFNAPFWEEVAFACINCGTCTYVCPTCWCFDIQDEVQGKTGVRMRNWDSCMYPLFTLHGSGHNPRDKKPQRVRQRFMHKLKYFVDRYDSGIQCVGCGRCVRLCPVNIDIRSVCELMNNYESSQC